MDKLAAMAAVSKQSTLQTPRTPEGTFRDEVRYVENEEMRLGEEGRRRERDGYSSCKRVEWQIAVNIFVFAWPGWHRPGWDGHHIFVHIASGQDAIAYPGIRISTHSLGQAKCSLLGIICDFRRGTGGLVIANDTRRQQNDLR